MSESTRSDPGLKRAIAAAGSIRALARALGMCHATLNKWKRIPAQRILDVERVTGVDRAELRPELYHRK